MANQLKITFIRDPYYPIFDDGYDVDIKLSIKRDNRHLKDAIISEINAIWDDLFVPEMLPSDDINLKEDK